MPAIDVELGYGLQVTEGVPEDFDWNGDEVWDNGMAKVVKTFKHGEGDLYFVLAESARKTVMFDADWKQPAIDLSTYAQGIDESAAKEDIYNFFQKFGFTNYTIDDCRWWIVCRDG